VADDGEIPPTGGQKSKRRRGQGWRLIKQRRLLRLIRIGFIILQQRRQHNHHRQQRRRSRQYPTSLDHRRNNHQHTLHPPLPLLINILHNSRQVPTPPSISQLKRLTIPRTPPQKGRKLVSSSYCSLESDQNHLLPLGTNRSMELLPLSSYPGQETG
jgi:hypothetical protein